MSKALYTIMSLFVAAMLASLPMQEAEAKRFGSGGSFGGKSPFGQKYQRNVERPQNATGANAMPQRSGGLGSILGGLVMGGLLAAIFMGGGFENINFFDILIFGLIAFMLFKLFAARRRPAVSHASTGNGFRDANEKAMQRGFDTDVMFKANSTADVGGNATTGGNTNTTESAPVYEAPKDFNEADFLHGANAAYRMLQQAWDDGELTEIRGLVTDKVFAEIQQQLQQRGGMNRTEIVNLDSRVLEIRTVGKEVEASVMFDSVLREIDDAQTEEAQAQQVREVWHFIKPLNGLHPTWYLDGIQQLEQ